MGRMVAITHTTLDGVMQAPARSDEDTRDNFRYGGWAPPYSDEVMAATVGPGMSAAGGAEDGGILLGRRTYQDFHEVWPKRNDGNPFTERLNAATKYVVSTTLTEPLPWQNSILLAGPVADEIGALKARLAGDLVVLGSGRLLQSLLKHALVDELVLTIHPLVLGSGHRLFPVEGPRIALQLVDTKPTTTGVIIARYRLAAPG